MDYKLGKELTNTFNTIGINLGDCGTNVEAWFDVDPRNKDFLIWLSKNLTRENTVSPAEIVEYEENIKQGFAVSESHDVIESISPKYPGIFDVAETEFEVECLEDEVNMLLDDKNKLDHIFQLHKNLHRKEKQSLTELEMAYIHSKTELEKAEEECFRMGCHLDEVNSKLHDSLAKCSEKLLEYECPVSTTYISNIPLSQYYNRFKNIISYFGLLDKKEFGTLPKLQSAVKTCSRITGSIFEEKTDDDLNSLKKKLCKSIRNRNHTECMKTKLQAEFDFLNHFDLHELINGLRFKQQLKEDVEMKYDDYEILSLELDNLSVEVSEKYIGFPSVAIAKQEITTLEEKLSHIREIESVFINIFAYHTVLYLMLVINNSDIQKSDEFFRTVHHYIANNLTKCELRTESMADIKREYILHESKPLKEKSSLLQVLLRLLPKSDMHESDIDALNNLQQQTFMNNFDGDLHFQRQAELIEKNNKVLRTFLTNGPTSEFVTFPFRVYQTFREIDNILNTKNNVITAAMAIWKDAVKQVSEDNWLKLKRQMWMYFLVQPHKVPYFIEKIKDEERKIRNEIV